MRVLMADDDAMLRHGLSVQLRRWGYDPIVCSSGAEAREALRDPDRPQLALLDRSMPSPDGLTLCAEIRSDPALRSTYVILITAHDSRDDVVNGLDGGADDYITKPFDWETLRARLKAGARIVSLQRDLAVRVNELQQALASVKQLSGLLPICSYCKRIRDDGDYWHQLETYVGNHSQAEFSHGVCPACLERVTKDFNG